MRMIRDGVVEIPSGQRAMKAFMARPAAEPTLAVIVAHGGQGLDNPTYERCRTLAAHGFVALAPEFGYGADATTPETSPDLHGELRATIAYIQTLPQTRALPIAVIGSGEGGLVCLLAVSRGDARRAVVLYGDALDRVRRAIRSGFKTGRRVGALLFVLGAEDSSVRPADVKTLLESLT